MRIVYTRNNKKPCDFCGKEDKDRGCRIVMNKDKELLRICNVCYPNLRMCMERHDR